LLRLGRPDARFDRVGSRLKRVLIDAIGQRKMFDDPYAGVFHILIFYGFLVVSVRTVSMVIEGLFAGWELPFLRTGIGHTYLLSKDLIEVGVLVGVALAMWRRAVSPPARIFHSFEAWGVLGLIILLMLTDLGSDGARIAAGMPASYLPVSTAVASLFGGCSRSTLQSIYGGLWWLHIVVLYSFANMLPYSKHFHVYTSLFNVFFSKLDPPGKLPTMDLENVDESSRIGISTVTDFTWKQMLDMYTCTECGRCRELCPTAITRKPLDPALYLKALRDQLYAEQNPLIDANGDQAKRSVHELIGTTVTPETIWACTTCRWCERACPLSITYTDKLVEMRRHLVLEKSEFPEEAQNAFRGYEVTGNPWQLGRDKRQDWARELGVPVAGDGAPFDYLFFVGSPGSYDEAAKRTSVALVKILGAAGIKTAILGNEEVSSGDAVRRLGNELLFQTLAQQNVATLDGHGVKKIVTNCPHVLNAIKNEYPDFKGHYEVFHGTQVVAELVRSGKVKLTNRVEVDVVFHDPCYLGRTNGELEAPRFLLGSIPGLKFREAEFCRERSMCCGAGGGRMWLEEKLGDRINLTRYKQLKASGTSDLAVACPYCRIMLSDAQKSSGDSDAQTYDVLELVARSLDVSQR
jgi:Fe-S oxidoreductase